ncbi:hypothetical protein N9478_07035 [Gammaproteobacteria bacterium]|nr:hypothetical protein [Gammaproteobacteria bacterium]
MISIRIMFHIRQSMWTLNDKKHTDIHSLNIIFGVWYDSSSE